MNDKELSIRMILVRKSVAIYDVQVKMMCTIGGNRYHLPLARGLTSYDHMWQVPMTFKHDITAEDSPLHGLEFAKVTSVSISVSATDNAGNPVMAHAMYYNPTAWLAGRPEFQGTFTNRPPYPECYAGATPIKFASSGFRILKLRMRGRRRRRRGSTT